MPAVIVEYKHAKAGVEKRFLNVNPETGAGSMDIEAKATAFPTPQMAWEATVKAAEALRAKGLAKMPGWARAACGLPSASGYRPADPYVCFNYLPQTPQAEIAGVMELCYIRSATQGWLSRAKAAPGQAPEARGMGWSENFALAIAFADPSQALAAAALFPAVFDTSVLKALSVFVSVEAAPGSTAQRDPLTAQIAAVCEARDIQSSLEASAAERLKEAGARAKARSPRL